MIVSIILPPSKIRGAVSRRLEIEGGETISFPVSQEEVTIEVADKKPITLRLFDIESKGQRSEPLEITFTAEDVPEFVPGGLKVIPQAPPAPVKAAEIPKSGGDQKSKPGVDDSGKKEVVAGPQKKDSDEEKSEK